MAIRMYYRVDFYEGAIVDDQIVLSLDPSTTPFAFAVGDFVDPSGWTLNPLPLDQHYEITAVEHQLTCPGDDEPAQHCPFHETSCPTDSPANQERKEARSGS